MRQWTPDPQGGPAAAGAWPELIDALAQPGFGSCLLQQVRSVVPATSLSVYRTGAPCAPERYLSASSRTPDTTRDCWRAYLSGPYLHDRTLQQRNDALPSGVPVVCHITAREVPREHRARVYEAHGMVERVSVLRRDAGGAVFAVNFYRHDGQRPFSEAQLHDFGCIAPALLALTRKHLQLAGLDASAAGRADPDASLHRRRLQSLAPSLTARELDVCERLLQGMTQDGIAAELGLSLPTVKTYRNRAFTRMGIHFRNELFALALNAQLH